MQKTKKKMEKGNVWQGNNKYLNLLASVVSEAPALTTLKQ